MAKSSLFSNTHNSKILSFFGIRPDFSNQEKNLAATPIQGTASSSSLDPAAQAAARSHTESVKPKRLQQHYSHTVKI